MVKIFSILPFIDRTFFRGDAELSPSGAAAFLAAAGAAHPGGVPLRAGLADGLAAGQRLGVGKGEAGANEAGRGSGGGSELSACHRRPLGVGAGVYPRRNACAAVAGMGIPVVIAKAALPVCEELTVFRNNFHLRAGFRKPSRFR